MGGFASKPHIQLHDFTITSPHPLPKLPHHQSRLALRFSINGVSGEVINACGDAENGIWEADGNVKIYENQLLTVTVLICDEDSPKELGAATISYSQLLAHAEARSKGMLLTVVGSEYYKFTGDGSTSSVLMLVTCSLRTSVPLPGKSKSDEGYSSSERALKLDALCAPNIADLERQYGRATSLPAERKSQALNAIGYAYQIMYSTTYEMEHLERAISILSEALQNAKFRPRLPNYLNDLAKCLLMRFERTGSHDDLEDAVSISQDAVHIAETSDPDRHRYISTHAMALLAHFILGNLEDLQSSISFMNTAVGLVPDSHPDKPVYLDSLGKAFVIRRVQLGHVEDLETGIVHMQKAVDLTPDGHPDKPRRLNNLGSAFGRRSDRAEDLEIAIAHTQKAVDLAPDGHPDKPSILNCLGLAFGTRFNQFDHVEDLERAIANTHKAVDLTLDGDPDKPSRLNSLWLLFWTRFRRLGRVEDMEMAIAHVQKASHLAPDDHPDKPLYHNNMSTTLGRRYSWLGRVEDLEMSITHMQKAVALMPDGHPEKPAYLHNLGNSFRARFDRLGRVEDLEIAITHLQKTIDLTPDGHPDKAISFNSLGVILWTRFNWFDRIEDLEIAIAYKQKAVDLTPESLRDKPRCLNSLGTAFKTRFDRLDSVDDLEMAIAYMQEAVDLTPIDLPDRSQYLNNLGDAFRTRFDRLNRIEDLETAAVQFSTAASLPTASPTDRLDPARNWADVSELLVTLGVPISSPLNPYHVIIDLLPRVAWLGIPISTQHALLEEVGGTVRDAVSAAIKMEEYGTAVEWAEAGRSIAWQNLLHLRTPVSELRNTHHDLAERLETISRQLDASVKGNDGGMRGVTAEMEQVSRSHVQLALDWDNIVADIRSKPGFESFLKPKSFNQLKRIARHGPVVILNVNKNRCDALVLIPENNGDVSISNISLGSFSYAKSEALLKELKSLLSSKHLRARDSRKPRRMPIDNGNGPPLRHIVRRLWLDVVKPIIDALAYQPRSTDLPHIWWCATGPLAFLPLHAAGLYDTDELGSKLSDYVVSSYIPTLSTLLDDTISSQEDLRLLVVAQANAPGASSIPETEVEVKKIQTLAKNINVTAVMKEDATVENVWRGMEKSNWVHLACHGQQNIKQPMKSGLLLHDGTLELQRLIEKPLPLADFAFLSACQTATGDESVAEESLHLAAGMLFAGYKGVIATMWSIMDDVGPRVAEAVYRVMLKDGKPNRRAAAYALHEAVKQLREDPKVDMLHWVPFIHIGR